MKFKNYTLLSFIDSFDYVWKYRNVTIISDGVLYLAAFQISNDNVAVYEWTEYPSLTEQDRIKLLNEKIDEVKTIYSSTIQLVMDRFPNTILYEVNCLIRRYGNDKPIDEATKDLNPKNNAIVKVYTNADNDNWWIKLLDTPFCSVSNEKAALQIVQYLLQDCINLITDRWKHKVSRC